MKIITLIIFLDYNLLNRFEWSNSREIKAIKKTDTKSLKTMGRLVQNHSTHIEGLIKWLKKMASRNEIKTVTPGPLSKTNGRGEKLVLKITVKTNEGYKLLARKGKLVQEVFLVTSIDENEIKEIIEATSPKSFRKKKGS
ncbi:DUF2103 domain-containing protein [Prochlorococcus sp. MIT 1011]|uniref:DUF2103 domain-containing protein n=1 Tax=Prochlorococcus sp. MIT 1011 TaxID=3082520 RepID=UPI0039B631ED